jgi:Ca-activated chloride channel family protein
MGFDKRKYIYMAVVAVVAAATLYVIYSLVMYGNPTEKSQNEYLIEANNLHNDSLYEAAVEPYIKAGNFNAQQSLVNYNTAVNTIMKSYPQLSKVFNDDGYQLEAAVDSALQGAVKRLAVAGDAQPDTAKYSSVFHNMGVTNHMRGELEAAANAYKEALRKNPADEDARYNLAVILHQMKNNQNQQQQQEQQQEQEEQQQEQQQQEQQQQEQEQQQQEQEKEQQEQQQNQPQQQQEQQQQQSESSEEDDKEKMEQMLKALMQDEKEIREKMEELEKAKSNSRSIEKNW